ncbi:hypothetical protein QVD17_21184 [Tagetes erecta]|uniref:Peptidase S8/S53 domain-containing protein n=1 Tax=Tagetes erecta TaxID=13708 RepID=A0AAD8NXV8_TARER|nr:hypothetical protein QVD17_21184 [Tagetes erecta]
MEVTFDAIAIGAFHAIERGILTVNSAGNNGPDLSSITTYAPWILHVGASDTDRKIVAKVLLGNNVILAQFHGLANGIARGGVPSSRLAVYKVCEPECPDTNILSAFDHAIADGVDIITISITHRDPMEVTFDAIAIGAFHAIERGILTVNSAGNNGPDLSSITTYAPWILHVGASDTGRKIVAKVLLGNNVILAVSI